MLDLLAQCDACAEFPLQEFKKRMVGCVLLLLLLLLLLLQLLPVPIPPLTASPSSGCIDVCGRQPPRWRVAAAAAAGVANAALLLCCLRLLPPPVSLADVVQGDVQRLLLRQVTCDV